MPTVSKICTVCGRDVSKRKRVKDAAGRYYCEGCNASASNRKPQLPAASIGVYVCTECGESFGIEDVFDSDGAIICEPCWNTKAIDKEMATSNVCSGCDQILAADVAFCSRCGRKNSQGLAIAEQIDLTEAVHWVSIYAEAAGTLATVHRLGDNLLKLGAQGGRIDPVEAQRMLEVGTRESDSADRVVAQAKANLAPFDRERLIGIRDQMLGHNSVPESAKAGLRFDPASIFGPPATRTSSDPMSEIAAAQQSLSGGYGKLSKSKKQSSGSRGRYAKTKKSTSVGYSLCLSSIGLGVLLLIASFFNLAVESAITSSVMELGVTAVVLIGLGLMVVANACPRCHLLFTSVLTNSESMGSHLAVRTEEKVARNYNWDELAPHSETRYDVDRVVKIQTFRNTKKCTRCAHVWTTTHRRES